MSRIFGRLHTAILISLLVAFSICTIVITRSERITTQEYVFCHTVLTKEHPQKAYFKDWFLGLNNMSYKEQSYQYEIVEQNAIFTACQVNAELAREQWNRKAPRYLVFTDTKKYLRELQENIYRINDLTERHLQYQLFLLEDQIVEEAKTLQKVNDKTKPAQRAESAELENRMINHMEQGQELLVQIKARIAKEKQWMKERHKVERNIRNIIMVLFGIEVCIVTWREWKKRNDKNNRNLI